MQLQYRGIPYHPHLPSVRYSNSIPNTIALTYRGISYAIERSQNTHNSDLYQAKMFLAYRGVLYSRA